jgi:hypothetical protein
LLLERQGQPWRAGDQHLGVQGNQLIGEHSRLFGRSRIPSNVDPQIAALCPTPLSQTLHECRDPGLSDRIVWIQVPQEADPPHAICLLRAPGERPGYCGAAEKRDELPALHVSSPRLSATLQANRKVSHHFTAVCVVNWV